jgi:peptidyl-prolyl cis-trans isomerase SurA
MKKIYLLFVLTVVIVPLFAQTLFTYGTDSVGKDEFLRAYNKNKTPVTDKEQALREYLDLYSKFKLKVKAAKLLRLDTLQQLQYDMDNFRSQVEEGYMNDEKGLNDLIDEALLRGQKEIRLLHFYVPIREEASPGDTLKAYKAIEHSNAAVKAGNPATDSLVKQTDLGYITVFSLPYVYENIVYGLGAGGVSKLFRTKNGWHIFKDVAERKSVGKWKVAQILLSIPPEASPETIKAIGHKADSIYEKLAAGEDFAEMAKKYSEDKLTYLNGGELSPFGTGKFEPAFAEKVFELKKDGDISRPFSTSHGFHIVKRIQQIPTPADRSDETYIYSLKQQILQDDRNNSAKQKFLKDVLVKIAYKRNPAVKNTEVFRFADSVRVNKKTGTYPLNNKTIFSFAKSSLKGDGWLEYVNTYIQNSDWKKEDNYQSLFDKYLEAKALEYYRKHLENYNTEFKYQMQEFREGNMLFEVMERNVWSKASNDSIGLLNYYNQHKEKYLWAPSATVLMFTCNDKKSAEDAVAKLRKQQEWKKIADSSEGKIQADSGRYEITQIQVSPSTKFEEGLISEPLINSADNTASFVKVLKIFPGNEQRSFEEARGLVINDYQNFLEEKWVEQLKIKYPVKVNEKVFSTLLK